MKPEPLSAPEPPPAPPDVAAEIFRERLPVAVRYAELLADSGVVRGLIGPRETPRLWDRHILNCAVLTELLEPAATVTDVGSGAGLPGLAVAIRRPDLQVTLVEPLLRRVNWLAEVIEDLELSNVTVARGRAEELWDKVPASEVVTSRAVSALDNLAMWSVPLVRPGGYWLPMKGASVRDEIEQSMTVLRAVGVDQIEVVECGVGLLDEPTTVARLHVGKPRRVRGRNAAKAKAKAKRSPSSQRGPHTAAGRPASGASDAAPRRRGNDSP